MAALDMVAAAATEQHGLFTRQNAVDSNMTPAQLHRLTAAGRAERLSYGLYRLTAVGEDRLTSYMEAALWSGGVISHASALEMQELCDILPRQINVTVPSERNPRKDGRDRYRVFRKTLDPRDLTFYEGVPVVRARVAVAQALADGEDPEQLRLAVANAENRGLLLAREAAALEEALG